MVTTSSLREEFKHVPYGRYRKRLRSVGKCKIGMDKIAFFFSSASYGHRSTLH